MGGGTGKGHPSAAQRRDAEGLTIGDSDAEDEPEERDPPDAHDHDDIPDPATFTSTQNRNSRIRNVKIPFFKGGANMGPGEYKEWRREIAAIKHSYKIEDKAFAGLVFLATEGDARDVLWNIDPSDFTDNPKCLSDMMDMLNKEFDRPEWEKADHAAEQFDKCRHAPGEKMIAYLRNMHRTYTKMLKEDKGTMVSNMSMARRILRRSGLSADEQRQVLSSCGHVYDMDKIKDALRLTFGDAHKDDRKRPFSTHRPSPTTTARRVVESHSVHGSSAPTTSIPSIRTKMTITSTTRRMRGMVMNKMDETIMKMNRKKMKMPSKILKLRLMTMTSSMTMTIFKNSSARSCSSCTPGRRCAQRSMDGERPLKERGKVNPMGQDHPAPTSPPRKPASASIVESTAPEKVMPSVTT